jgi:hypothetical protein
VVKQGGDDREAAGLALLWVEGARDGAFVHVEAHEVGHERQPIVGGDVGGPEGCGELLLAGGAVVGGGDTAEVAHDAAPGRVGRGAVVGEATRAERKGAPGAGLGEQGGSKARLADAGLALHADGSPSRCGGLELSAEPGERAVAADQGGVVVNGCCNTLTLAEHAQQTQRLALAARPNELWVAHHERAADQIGGGGGAAQFAPGAVSHHAGRHVHGVAHHRVLFALGAAHVAREDVAGVEADAQPQQGCAILLAR